MCLPDSTDARSRRRNEIPLLPLGPPSHSDHPFRSFTNAGRGYSPSHHTPISANEIAALEGIRAPKNQSRKRKHDHNCHCSVKPSFPFLFCFLRCLCVYTTGGAGSRCPERVTHRQPLICVLTLCSPSRSLFVPGIHGRNGTPII